MANALLTNREQKQQYTLKHNTNILKIKTWLIEKRYVSVRDNLLMEELHSGAALQWLPIDNILVYIPCHCCCTVPGIKPQVLPLRSSFRCHLEEADAATEGGGGGSLEDGNVTS